MGNLRNRKRLLIIAFFVLLACIFMFGNEVSAETYLQKDEVKQEDSDSDENHDGFNSGNGCEAYVSEKAKEQCMKDRIATTKTADFYTVAIMSLDENVAKQELNEDYVVNFSNSSATAVAYDIYLADPETILMHIVNIVTSILEKIGSFVTLIVMILYNVASSSFWTTIIENIFGSLDKILFDWGNPNSYFMKLVFLFGCIGVTKRMFKVRKRTFTFRVFLSTIASTVASCMLVVFIARYGRPLIMYTENLISDSIVQTFVFPNEDVSVPLEIHNKRIMFDSLQKQGFILRHFGVTDVSQISDTNSGDYSGISEGEKIPISSEERVATLLNDPSKDNAQRERQDYGSTDISYNFFQCMNVLGLSFVFFIHRLLLGALYASSSLVLFGIGFLKEVLLAVTVYGIVFMLTKEDKRMAGNWFMGRLQWSLLFLLSHLVFSMLIFFTNTLVSQVTAYGLLLVLPFDALLVLLFMYAYKNKEDIWKKLTADVDIDGDGIFDVGKAIINGGLTPGDMYNNRKDRKRQEELDDELNDEDSDDTTSKKSALSDMDSSKNDLSEEDSEETEVDMKSELDIGEETEESISEEEDINNEIINSMEKSAEAKEEENNESSAINLNDSEELEEKGFEEYSSISSISDIETNNDLLEEDELFDDKNSEGKGYDSSNSDITDKKRNSSSGVDVSESLAESDSSYKSDMDIFMEELIEDEKKSSNKLDEMEVEKYEID